MLVTLPITSRSCLQDRCSRWPSLASVSIIFSKKWKKTVSEVRERDWPADNHRISEACIPTIGVYFVLIGDDLCKASPLTTCAVPSHPNQPGRTGCSLSFLLLLLFLSAFLLPFAFVCQPKSDQSRPPHKVCGLEIQERKIDLFLSPPSQSVSQWSGHPCIRKKRKSSSSTSMLLWGLKGTKMKTIENEDGNDDERPCVCVCVWIGRLRKERQVG